MSEKHTYSMLKKLKQWFSSPPTLEHLLRSGQYDFGIPTSRNILSHPAVWRGVDLLSTSVARIPFVLYDKTDEARQKAINHPAYSLIKTRPNRYYSSFQMFKSWMVNTLTHGDGYIYIDRDDVGRPTELILLDSSQVAILADNEEISYSIYQNKRHSIQPASNILHLRGLSTDGLCGLPLERVLADAFGVGLTLQKYTNTFFLNAGRPSIVIKLPPEITTAEQIEEFREAWNGVHGQGIESSFKPALMRPGAEITTLENDNAITSLATLREHDLITIANILGLPPHKLGAKSQSVSYNSLEQENLSFLDDLDGWLVQIEQELSFKLCRRSEVLTHYFEANREARVQVDSQTKAELLAIYRRNGMMSDEEIRQKLNMSTDMVGTFWTEANMITREKALIIEEPEPVIEDVIEEPETVEETEEETEETQLSKQLTQKTVERLIRRANKSGKIDIEIWSEELSFLPNYKNLILPVDEFAAVLPEQRKTLLDANIITEQLWKI